jgi:hypothetical protein
MLHWAMIGVILQLYGIVYLFGQFFPIAANAMRNAPIIGAIFRNPAVEEAIDRFGSSSLPRRNAV